MLTSNKVLVAISDDITANIFKIIANSNSGCSRNILLSRLKATKKQYYSRIESLTKAGLIRRKSGIYYLTSFGKVIYRYHLEIETALSYHWKLEALDSILLSQSSDKAKIPLEEKVNLVEKLIENREIKDIISPIISNNNTSADNVAADHSNTWNTDPRQRIEKEVYMHF
jgi:hypothetical protein